MQIIFKNSSLRLFLHVGIFGTIYWIVAKESASCPHTQTLAANVWPAPCLAIAMLWRMHYRRWPPYLVAIFIALLVEDIFSGTIQRDNLWYALLNVAQVALCAGLGRNLVAIDGELDSISKLMRFILLLPLTAIILIASSGATIAELPLSSGWWKEWLVLLIGNGLPVLILVPTLLTWCNASHLTKLIDSNKISNPLLGNVLCVLGMLTIIGISTWFDVATELLKIVLSLVLISSAVYGGMRSATINAVTLATLVIMLEIGPYSHDTDGILYLQVDLAGLTLLSFFVAIATRESQRLSMELSKARRLESIGLMTGGIVHDVNNIIGAAGGYTELAIEYLPANSPARAPLREVTSAVTRCQALSRHILLTERYGNPAYTVLNLCEIATEAMILAKPLCKQTVTLSLILPPFSLPILAQRDQILRATFNLISNAIRVAHSRVIIKPGTGLQPAAHLWHGEILTGNCSWIEIIDDGSGIAPEHIKSLFEPFFSTQSASSGNAGLGLAIVASIIHQHHGSIGVSSSANGSQLQLLLPSADHAVVAHQQLPLPLMGNGERILLLIAPGAMCDCYEHWIAKLGFEPCSHTDAPLALSGDIDAPEELFLILADIDNLQLHGIALTDYIRTRLPKVALILFSKEPQLSVISNTAGAAALPYNFDQIALAKAIVIAGKLGRVS